MIRTSGRALLVTSRRSLRTVGVRSPRWAAACRCRGRVWRGWRRSRRWRVARLGRDPLGRLAEGVVDLELGDVVLAHGSGVLLVGRIQGDECGDDLLGADDQAEQLAGRPRRLAQADEV